MWRLQRPKQFETDVTVRPFPVANSGKVEVNQKGRITDQSTSEEDMTDQQQPRAVITGVPYHTLPRVDGAYKKRVQYYRHVDGTITNLSTKIVSNTADAYTALPTHKKVITTSERRRTRSPDFRLTASSRPTMFNFIDKHSRPSSRAIEKRDVKRRKIEAREANLKTNPRSRAKEANHVVHLHPGDSAHVKLFCK